MCPRGRHAVTEMQRVQDFALASAEPWEPRLGSHLHGPTRLPIRFTPGQRAAAAA